MDDVVEAVDWKHVRAKVEKASNRGRLFRGATQQDIDLINNIKAKNNAGAKRNAAIAREIK